MDPNESLCINDPRNPYFNDYGEDNVPPRENCACDNCFYGRDAMALEIIRLREAIENLGCRCPHDYACQDHPQWADNRAMWCWVCLALNPTQPKEQP